MSELMTLTEIAAHFRTSKSFWYKRNVLPVDDPMRPPTVRVGAYVLYKLSEVEDWLAKQPPRATRKDKGQPRTKHECDVSCTFGNCDCTCHCECGLQNSVCPKAEV